MSVEPLGAGLINDTYRVKTAEEDAPDCQLPLSPIRLLSFRLFMFANAIVRFILLCLIPKALSL